MHLRTFRGTSFGGDGFFSRRAEGETRGAEQSLATELD